jgi:hypothetical protein
MPRQTLATFQYKRYAANLSEFTVPDTATHPILDTVEERPAVMSNEAATGGGGFNSQGGALILGGGNCQQTTKCLNFNINFSEYLNVKPSWGKTPNLHCPRIMDFKFLSTMWLTARF